MKFMRQKIITFIDRVVCSFLLFYILIRQMYGSIKRITETDIT